jgi:tetratricopeptide (TPR) repeat protein
MKKILLIFCFGFLFCTNLVSQTNIIDQFAKSSCLCIDSISVSNISPVEASNEIKKCIDKQVMAYQLLEILTSAKDTKSNIEVGVGTEDTEQYKKYYAKLESNLMESCKSIRDKIAINNKTSFKSGSENVESLKNYNLGINYLDKKDYKSALPYFTKAVTLDQNFAFAWDNIGVCQRQLGNLDEALVAYEKSLSIDPNGLLPLQNIPIVYIYKKEYNKAIKSYKDLAKVDSKNPEIYYGIGQVYFEYLKDYENSLENICIAYKLYDEMKSPYKADAEKIIGYNYQIMKKQGKLDAFEKIMKKNKIKF